MRPKWTSGKPETGTNPQNKNCVFSRGYLWEAGRRTFSLVGMGWKSERTIWRQTSGLSMCLLFKVPPGCPVSWAPHPGLLSTGCVPVMSLAPRIMAPEPKLAWLIIWVIHSKASWCSLPGLWSAGKSSHLMGTFLSFSPLAHSCVCFRFRYLALCLLQSSRAQRLEEFLGGV